MNMKRLFGRCAAGPGAAMRAARARPSVATTPRASIASISVFVCVVFPPSLNNWLLSTSHCHTGKLTTENTAQRCSRFFYLLLARQSHILSKQGHALQGSPEYTPGAARRVLEQQCGQRARGPKPVGGLQPRPERLHNAPIYKT